MKNKKTILILAIIILFLALAFIIAGGVLPRSGNKTIQNKTIKKTWNVYKNEEYGYSFKYPASLIFGKHCAGYPEGVVFSDDNAAVRNLRDSISVLIYDTDFISIEEWLKKENNNLKNNNIIRVLEREVIIDGNRALVTYLENQKTANDPYGKLYEKSKGYSKKTAFIKDRKLFEINTRFVDYKFTKEGGMTGPIWNGRITDHEYVWNSFKVDNYNSKKQGLLAPKSASDGWKSYLNKEYNYSVDYPGFASINDYCVGYPNQISFSDSKLDDYGIMSISVFKNTEFLNVNEWLKIENKKIEKSRVELEKIIFIDGYEAIVTHQVNMRPKQEEHFSHEKKTVFIKDNSLFIIWTRFMEEADHQRVWQSFKFGG